MKVTPQPFTSSLSEDPTLLCESHERLSLSGQEMEDTSTIGMTEFCSTFILNEEEG